jgi:hypothetical protein
MVTTNRPHSKHARTLPTPLGYVWARFKPVFLESISTAHLFRLIIEIFILKTNIDVYTCLRLRLEGSSEQGVWQWKTRW